MDVFYLPGLQSIADVGGGLFIGGGGREARADDVSQNVKGVEHLGVFHSFGLEFGDHFQVHRFLSVQPGGDPQANQYKTN